MRREKITEMTNTYGFRALYFDENDGNKLKRMSEVIFDTQQECMDFILNQKRLYPAYEEIKTKRVVYKLTD